jgi:hypothetical protein
VRTPPRRDYRWGATSLALHVVVIALLVRIVMVPGTIMSFFEATPRLIPPPPEKIIFVPLPARHDTSVARAQIDGGDDRKAAPDVGTAPMLRAPITVPNELPTAPRITVTPGEPGGSGPLIGGGGALRGVQPSYGDGRLWSETGPLIGAPKTDDERRDSVFASRLGRYQDSLNLAERGQVGPGERPAWIYNRGGDQYGIDKNKIHLGKFSLPSALLYQLPLAKYQGDISRDRERNMIAAEMFDQTHRRLNEEQFRAAVKAIRERKERERREADASKRSGDPAVTPLTAGTR